MKKASRAEELRAVTGGQRRRRQGYTEEPPATQRGAASAVPHATMRQAEI